MTETKTPFNAIVLAGQRPGKDPVAEAAGVACKSFAPIGDRPMVHRVLDTLAAARQVGSMILCGPSQPIIDQEPELKARIERGEVKWIANHSTPSVSTYHALQSLPPKRTAMKFKDGAYCGCNLFGFLNPRAHRAAQFWRQIEQERKKPLKMMRILGWRAVVRYLMGRTSLDQGLERISRKLQIRARAILLPFPEAAVDVDTIDHWQFAQKLAQKPPF
jgi:CTP:molybdopterin cytidylyltransferase MocA